MLTIVVLPGLKLQGATCANNKLSLSTTISTELPLTQLRWIKQSTTEKRHTVKDQQPKNKPENPPGSFDYKNLTALFLDAGDSARVPELHPV